MPDKGEDPWYASCDLAFHCIAIALVDADFAKEQLEALKLQIMQQTATSALAQANASPQIVLSLFG